MDARQAARTLEVIRTLMERTCQYQLLTARAGLAAGCLAGLGRSCSSGSTSATPSNSAPSGRSSFSDRFWPP